MAPPKAFLTARWEHLAMLNYEVDPALLRRFVPPLTELDAYSGKTFVSVVGFMFRDTKVLGLSIPFHRTFEEINLRFYVRSKASSEIRRGVVFIKEIVPRFAIAASARNLYGENYYSHPMRNRIELDSQGEPRVVEYGWKAGGAWNSLVVMPEGPALELRDGSEEEFITEHYWGYTALKDGRTLEYKVEHPRWKYRKVSSVEFRCDVASQYGKEFVEPLSTQPHSAFLAVGSPVTVYRYRSLA